MQEFLITAVDIGTRKISASCGQSYENEEVEILGSSCVDSSGVEKGELIDSSKCRETFIKVLKTLEEEVNKEINDIYIGIPTTHTRVIERSFIENIYGKVTYKDLNKVIKNLKKSIYLNDNEEICDILVNYYKVDEKISTEPVLEWEGEKLEINATVIVCDKKVLNKYEGLCKGTKYKIKGFVVNIMSLRKIFFFDNKLGERVIVQCGAGITELGIFRNGIFKEGYSIPLGGDNITSDLSICAGLSYEEAEKLKYECSNKYKSECSNFREKEIVIGEKNIHKELFYKVCQARIEEILNYVNNELKNTSHFNDICSIILCSDSLTNFEDISEIAENIIHNNIRIITKNEFGMQNFSNITSLAIVKEVHDRVKLIYEDFTKEVKDDTLILEKVSDINRDQEKIEDSKQKTKKRNESIRGKLRSLLEDIF
ncbi:MAG: cell division FtsA domain-containing protein [Clostridium sp.]|uniref:cell division FtsA domain-containing protein n=1 Tax=Clostridium sp. TaxID=1506 RepID=UPI002FC70825